MTLTVRLTYIYTLARGRKRFPKDLQEVIGHEFFRFPWLRPRGPRW